ncbi:hypothetical protein PACTADRAFT_50589 [Pachysolen tannophilus NRRL Y-2460]|uniref:Mitochondrial Rho GTPase n=1 Tax=Pachysolen tannophilus NRRL Y-2460 TaxID=669874 RepID=A0A1E4TSM5_PACTA|nr:hypothetical protein PACTADRAFT_50589 [Pachysolen tannophilus NRRL Y-2460]
MSTDTIRVVVCGDEGVGKSCIITSLVKEAFVPNIQHVIPEITIPRDFSSSPYSPNSTILIDTSSSELSTLQKEIRQADVIWLIYSDHYTYERISLYWMMMFRSMGVNLPVVVCANKSDLIPHIEHEKLAIDEFLPLLRDFKEIESCVRCSAKENYNITQAFYICQRAVTHPISPIFDYKEGNLKPLAIDALKRIFFLSDRDQDGYLNDKEFVELQKKCFTKGLDINEMNDIKSTIIKLLPQGIASNGISEQGFLALNKFYAENGRHETTWGILRTFHYTDSLSLSDKILYPKFDVPNGSSVELSPIGYKFLVDLFLLFDKDNDGGLNDEELRILFKPTPGIPKSWQESNFPRTIVCNEQGYVTLQGWLAQWSMTTFLDFKTTLAYLGYLGFESNVKNGSTTSALKITKPRKIRKRKGKSFRAPVNDRTVFNCFVLGSPGSGKTSLLEAFLGRQYSELYSPTIQQRIVANTVELTGGKQCYLILEELGELEPAILENQSKLDQCDILCYTYDSADPDSFNSLVELREKYPQLDGLPAVFVALKADLDRQQQRSDLQPEPYTRSIFLPAPLHISSSWSSSLNELFVTLVETAKLPSNATPNLEPEPESDATSNLVIAGGSLAFMAIVSIWFLRGTLNKSSSS